MVSAVVCAIVLESTHSEQTKEIDDHENSSVILNNFLASSPTHIDAFR
jgi:hypothetical protein